MARRPITSVTYPPCLSRFAASTGQRGDSRVEGLWPPRSEGMERDSFAQVGGPSSNARSMACSSESAAPAAHAAAKWVSPIVVGRIATLGS